jgi:anti-sigma factor RsiW
MTLIVRCDDKHRLVSYLYGETSSEEQAAVESHLATCAECSAEFGALQDVRGHLAGWQAPETDLGFTITRAAAPLVPTAPALRRSWAVPAWAQAAAAVLVLSAGAAIANLEVRYGSDGFTVRTGWSRQVTASAAPSARPPVITTASAAGDADATRAAAAWQAALAESEKRLRAEFAAQRTSAPAPVLTRTGASGDEVLRQVRALIEESERRQRRELALRVSQVTQDVEMQRRADLVRIEQNMGQIEGLTGAETARQRELLNYLVRVSQRR